MIIDKEGTQPTNVVVQAALLERTLPEIARRLFTHVDDNNPLAELPGAQLKVCVLLMDGRRTMSQIGEELHISVSAVTQIADRLEKAGLVERVAPERDGGGDRRARFLALTPHGAELMAGRRRWRTERVERALSRLSEEERARLLHSIEDLLDACRRL